MLTKQVTRRNNSRRAVNDNFQRNFGDGLSPRRSGGAANDNLNSPPKRKFRRLGGLRQLSRVLPPLRILNLGLMLYQARSPSKDIEEGWDNLGAWSLWQESPSKSPVYTEGYGLISQSSAVENIGIRLMVQGGWLGQGVTQATVGNPWASVNNSSRSIAIGKTYVAPGGIYLAQAQQAYNRPTSGAFEKPVYRPAQKLSAQWTMSEFPYQIGQLASYAPHLFPPSVTPHFPPPVPWHEVPNWEAPNRETSNGEPAPLPVGVSPVEWSYTADYGGRPRPAPKQHRHRPPPRDVNERKQTMTKSQIIILRSVSQVTEVMDFVDALYDAIPDKHKLRWKNTQYQYLKPTPVQKFKHIIDAYEHIDWTQAIENLYLMQAEDTAIGTLGKMGGTSSRDHHRPYGTGINTTMRQLQKLSGTYTEDKRN